MEVNPVKITISSLILFSCVSLSSAENVKSPFNGLILELNEEIERYSFLIGGHLYGAPENKHSVFPSSSFLANIEKINSIDAKFFISLGDNYRRADNVNINNYITTVALKLKMPLFNSVGNHDLTNRGLYEANFGKTYYHFAYKHELFIFLDSELNAGKIMGEQSDFLLDVVQNAIKNQNIKNVFLFSHKLIWSVNNPAYRIVFEHLNSHSGYTNTDNFKNEIEPVLIDLSRHKAVYWISGDIGCSWSLPLFFEQNKNSTMTYIATGVGDTEKDVILQVNIGKSGDEVTFTPVSLTGQKMYPVAHYGLKYWENYFQVKTGSNWRGKISRMLRHKYFRAGVLTSYLFLGSAILILKRMMRWLQTR
jgi:hypothetical protein